MKADTDIWLKLAKDHYDNAEYLYKGRRYSMAVYCCHQALEMILKAAIVEFTGKVPPKIHKLDELAVQSKLPIPSEWLADLAEITSHFWRVRYPDFQAFVYTSKEKVEPTVKKTREIYLWVSKQFNQK